MVPAHLAILDFGVMTVHIIATADVPANVDKRMAIVHRVMIGTGATHVKSNVRLGARTPAINTQDIVRSVKSDIGDTHVMNSVVRDVHQQHVKKRMVTV